MEADTLVSEGPQEEDTTCISRAVTITVILTALAGLLIVYFVNPSNNNSTLNFILFNDIHYDPMYSSNGTSSINFCRNSTKSNVSYVYGQYGCDTPNATLESMLDYAKSVLKNPAFIVIGGDVLAHNNAMTREEADRVHLTVRDMIKSTFTNTNIFMTLGNTDFLKDYGDFDTDSVDFTALDTTYGGFLSSNDRKTFISGGYYYRDFPEHKVRILFLNTIMYSVEREFNESRVDPYNQFAFILNAAKEAANEGLSVGAIIHLPPGITTADYKKGFHEFYAKRFNEVVKEAGIRFILSGHTHYDSFLPLYHSEDNSLHTLSSPAVSPFKGNNPAFRVVSIRMGDIENYNQYYADITFNPKNLQWEEEYSFTNEFDASDVSPNSVKNAIEYSKSSGTGRWRYRERLFARADQSSPFYYCLINCFNETEMQQCISGYSSKETQQSSYISDEI